MASAESARCQHVLAACLLWPAFVDRSARTSGRDTEPCAVKRHVRSARVLLNCGAPCRLVLSQDVIQLFGFGDANICCRGVQLLGWTDVQRAEDKAAGIDKSSLFIKIGGAVLLADALLFACVLLLKPNVLAPKNC